MIFDLGRQINGHQKIYYVVFLQVVVSQSQEGFIKGVMLPMYSELCKIDDVLAKHHFVNPLKDALLRYELENIRKK